MDNEDMIIWFVKQIGFSNKDIAEMFTLECDETTKFKPSDIKIMMLKRKRWPYDTWHILRAYTVQRISYIQRDVDKFNETYATQYKMFKEELMFPLGRLGVFMACMLLAEDVEFTLE